MRNELDVLTAQALGYGALTASDAERIESELYGLLAERANAYSRGDSSLPAEIARELLDSIVFTVCLALKADAEPASMLNEMSMGEIYYRGLRSLDERIAAAKLKYNSLMSSMLPIDNVAYRDTAREIGAFFGRYRYDMFAQQIPCMIDYQLFTPIQGLRGIEYIEAYMNALIAENEFCRHFDFDVVIRLLQAYCADYKGLLVNIFEPVAANALGLELLGREPLTLDITRKNKLDIAERFGSCPKRPLERAARSLSKRLGLSDDGRYLALAADELAVRIELLAPTGGIHGIFTSINID